MDIKATLKRLCETVENKEVLREKISVLTAMPAEPYISWSDKGVFVMVPSEGEGIVYVYAKRGPDEICNPAKFSIADSYGRIETVFGWVLPFR